jgi:GNAT superfamily N-acetyltransferase
MGNMKIKKAKRKDTAIILNCIKGLAEYVGQLDQVTATEEKLEETLFSKNSNVEVRLAYLGDTIIGFVLFFKTYSTFKANSGLYIEDLFIFSEYRNKGYGKQLFNYVIDFGLKYSYNKVEWYVNIKNNNAISFYLKMKAKKLDYKSIYYIDLNKK